MEIDHLGFAELLHCRCPVKVGERGLRTRYYFYMNVPEDFEPVCNSITEDGQTEYLEWVSPDEPRTIFPNFSEQNWISRHIREA